MPLFRFFILAALCMLPSVGSGQGLSLPIPDRSSKEWRRISTDQNSTTDVGVASLTLEPNGMFRATFRIGLSKAEEAPGKPGAKYKTQLLTLQFDSKKSAYRIFETTLQDSSGKAVYASGPNPSATWKPLGRSGHSFYSAAADLRIDAALVTGYFQEREELSREPNYRNVWGILREFGDSGVAALVAPRGLVVEAARGPEGPGRPATSSPPQVIHGRLQSPPVE